MRREKIDGLFVDYVLGELEPEVEALVESYVEVEPSARARCEETRELLGVVERVEGEVFATGGKRRPRPVVWVAAVSAVAALLVGGWFITSPSNRGDGAGGAVAVADETEARGGGDGSGFWSVPERQERRAGAGKKRRLTWESMMRRPRIEGKPL